MQSYNTSSPGGMNEKDGRHCLYNFDFFDSVLEYGNTFGQ